MMLPSAAVRFAVEAAEAAETADGHADSEELAVGLAAIMVLGVGAQWLGSKLNIPSILLLLMAGLMAGPIFDIVDPDTLFGPLLFPAVSLAVGILLFEGGLGLRFADLDRGRGTTIRLVTVGVAVTWVIGSAAAFVLLPVSREQALLLGSILVVSGPTVVLPILRLTRPREPTASILRWEGIFIDPIGATLAIVVLDAIIDNRSGAEAIARVASTSGVGITSGLIGAVVLTELLKRHAVPDHLQNPVTLMIMVASYAGANLLRPEAGLFATTVMGVALANQRRAAVSHIREFEENLGTLILAGVFVTLGARVELSELTEFLPGALGMLLVLVLVARPVAVYASTVGTGIAPRDRAFLMCLAPRGIVAAAVSALFALELEEVGMPFPELVPVTFMVIVGTVLIYGLGASVFATGLRVGRAKPKGIAFVGGQPWVVALADELAQSEIPVLIISSDEREIEDAMMHGLLSYSGRLDSEDLAAALDGVGIAAAVAVSRSNDLNLLAVRRMTEHLGRANVFLLPQRDVSEAETGLGTDTDYVSAHPFSENATQVALEALVARGGRFITTPANEPDLDEKGIPILDLDQDGLPRIVTVASRKPASNAQWRVLLTADPDAVDHTEPLDLEAVAIDPPSEATSEEVIASGADEPST